MVGDVFLFFFSLAFVFALSSPSAWAQGQDTKLLTAPPPPSGLDTTEDWNRRLQQLLGTKPVPDRAITSMVPSEEYRIGPEDLLEISVFEAADLNRTVRVTAGGEISLPLLGTVKAGGLSARELESVLEELLRRTYMQDPHVGVFVREMQSHPVSVFGAVKKPGVIQIRNPRTLIEILSLAEGLDDEAGDTVIVTRGGTFRAGTEPTTAATDDSPSTGADAGQAVAVEEGRRAGTGNSTTPGESIEINLKSLLGTADASFNIIVYPGDIVKVTRAGIVYVVGDVKKPGGFVLKTNENISVLQALALAEGPTSTAARSKSRIIRTDELSGAREEIPIDLGKILEGKEADPLLQPKDIVFVPGSAARKGFYRGAEAAVSIVSGLIIWRR